jgi:hypothetical protein
MWVSDSPVVLYTVCRLLQFGLTITRISNRFRFSMTSILKRCRDNLYGLCVTGTATTEPLCYKDSIYGLFTLGTDSTGPLCYRESLYGLCIAVTATTGPLCYMQGQYLWPLYFGDRLHRTSVLQG